MKIIKPIKEYNLNKEYLHEMQINEKFIMNDNKYIAIVSTEFNLSLITHLTLPTILRV